MVPNNSVPHFSWPRKTLTHTNPNIHSVYTLTQSVSISFYFLCQKIYLLLILSEVDVSIHDREEIVDAKVSFMIC